MGYAFMLKKYVFQKLKICFEICLKTSKYILKNKNLLFVYSHSDSDLFCFFKIMPISNKMDNYN